MSRPSRPVLSAVAESLDSTSSNAHPLAVVPRVTLRPPEAAAALGVSDDYFREHVAPDLGVIRRGRLRLYRVAELARWAEQAEEPAPLDRTLRGMSPRSGSRSRTTSGITAASDSRVTDTDPRTGDRRAA